MNHWELNVKNPQIFNPINGLGKILKIQKLYHNFAGTFPSIFSSFYVPAFPSLLGKNFQNEFLGSSINYGIRCDF
jgi:hypothetical protein